MINRILNFFQKILTVEKYYLIYKKYLIKKLDNEPSVEEIISVTLNCILIRMTEINRVDRSVLYQEFKEWILNSSENNQNQEILCLRYLKNDKKIN